MDSKTLIEFLVDIVGMPHVAVLEEDKSSYLIDIRRRYRGDALCVVSPASTEEVSRVVKLCYDHDVPIAPVGGNTGLVGGACARFDRPGILLSLRRMNRLREISTVDDTIAVDAGCVLMDIQAAAQESGRLFPLSLSAEGSCQIGGNISTNAGGMTAVRYGVMRQLVLGLEVVLPDGHVIDGMLHLRKDNTGYDLKHLFIGAEGTLGIITGAVLKLFPAPRQAATAMLAVASVNEALKIFSLLRQRFSERVTSFEIINRSYMELICERMENARAPFDPMPAWHLLVEVTDSDADANLRETFELALADAIEAGHASDAVIAQSEAQTQALWDLRHWVSDSIRFAPNMSHDSSVPLDEQPAYSARVEERIKARFPAASVLMVGHLGDGNMHVVVLFRPGYFADDDAYLAVSAELDEIIDGVVVELRGSITAEHGIGLSYRKRLAKTKDPHELMLMRHIKQVFDPKSIMNPGKLFEPLK